jgi:hypothetical protein
MGEKKWEQGLKETLPKAGKQHLHEFEITIFIERNCETQSVSLKLLY